MNILVKGFFGNFGMFLLEFFGGLWSGSLALISDSFHLFGDAVALGISWRAERFAGQPASPEYTFGRAKAKALAAVVNVVFLASVVTSIVIPEAVRRFFSPSPVLSGPMLIIAVVGLCWNAWLSLQLRGEVHEHHIRSARLQVNFDFFSSIGVVAAAGLIWLTGASWLDPAASILVASGVAISGWRVFKDAGDELLDKAPAFPWEEFDRLVMAIPGVLGWHEPHLRRVGKELNMTIHIHRTGETSQEAIEEKLDSILHRFGITHHTIRTETARCTEVCVFTAKAS